MTCTECGKDVETRRCLNCGALQEEPHVPSLEEILDTPKFKKRLLSSFTGSSQKNIKTVIFPGDMD